MTGLNFHLRMVWGLTDPYDLPCFALKRGYSGPNAERWMEWAEAPLLVVRVRPVFDLEKINGFYVEEFVPQPHQNATSVEIPRVRLHEGLLSKEEAIALLRARASEIEAQGVVEIRTTGQGG